MTDNLANIIGLYFVIAGTAVMFDRIKVRPILDGFKASPALCYSIGAIMTLAGGAMVFGHNIWTDFKSGFVSLVGWGMLLEGAAFLVAPHGFIRLTEKFIPPNTVIRLLGAALIPAGIALIWL